MVDEGDTCLPHHHSESLPLPAVVASQRQRTRGRRKRPLEALSSLTPQPPPLDHYVF